MRGGRKVDRSSINSLARVNVRLPTVVAALSITGLMAWMASIAPDATVSPAPAAEPGPEAPLQEHSTASGVPCAVPLAWRIARVDPEFGLSAAEAALAVQEAASLWESGVRQGLFVHDPEGGFPVRLVYDDRQQELGERLRRERELESVAAQLREAREALLERGLRHQAATAAHRRAMEQTSEALGQEQAALQAEGATLDAELVSLQNAEEQLNERIAEHARLADELAADFPTSAVEAGEYREAVTTLDGRVESVSREIRLYRFSSASDLKLVAAHELGHALGLGHTSDPDGIMSAAAVDVRTIDRIAASDATLFGETCPALLPGP